MTVAPEALGPEDAEAVRRAGVEDEALWDAIHVAVAFNVINRVADGLGFVVPSPAQLRTMGKVLLRVGYE